ncbi:hypothetical protein BDQ17DRAFT_1542942 [Cyathus striatus]|nr:hypothetical protein BDQ17DRAFT_1542942 [Cyathus striatus]
MSDSNFRHRSHLTYNTLWCTNTFLECGLIFMYGAIFTFGVYCINVVVVLGYLHLVLTHLAKKKRLRRHEWILSIYVILAFISSTFCVTGAINDAVVILSVICDVYSGSPYSESPDSDVKTGFMFVAGFMFSAWAVDVIMIWRFLVVYHDFRLFKWIILGFSSLLLMGSIAFGMLQAIMTSINPAIYLVVLEAFALSQNMLLTSLIVGRLLLFRYRTRKALGAQHGNEYINVTTMIVESQALLGIGQVVLLATILPLQSPTLANNNFKNSPSSVVMYRIVGQLQVLTPVLLIYRVMQGKTYDSKTVVEMGTVGFSAGNGARKITA